MSKNIIITGGSDGLGKAVAKLLSKDNNVIIISRTEEKSFEISGEITTAECYTCDVTDYEEVNKVIETIVYEQGNIDVLINNAGVWLEGDLTDNSYADISRCIDINTKGSIYMTKAVLPYMYEANKGLIINVCSQYSFDNEEISPVYNASKWAMRGFNRSIQKTLSKKNIRLTGFYPGLMQTNIFKKVGKDYDLSTGIEVDKAAKAIEYIVNAEENIVITEYGIKGVSDY